MNEHPLTDDLTQMTMEDLEKRLSDLMSRWSMAKRMNMNPQILYQLDLLLQGVEHEKSRRLAQPEDPRKVVLDTDGGYKDK